MTALDEVEHDICFNDTLNTTCPTGYTFMILNAFYGIKKQASNKCGFIPDDCTEKPLLSIRQCQNDLPNCYLSYSTRYLLLSCSFKYADYLHITSQCVPSRSIGTESTVKIYDICEANDSIANINGIVISPNFPTYIQIYDECKRTIIGIRDRVLKIWINEMALSDNMLPDPDLVIFKNNNKDNSNIFEQIDPSTRDICTKDYFIINAPYVTYVYCGIRKLVIAPICGTSVVIQYKTSSPPDPLYKGFKFYFEWIEKPMNLLCDDDLLESTTFGNELISIGTTPLTTSQRSMTITNYDSNHILMLCIVMAKFILEH